MAKQSPPFIDACLTQRSENRHRNLDARMIHGLVATPIRVATGAIIIGLARPLQRKSTGFCQEQNWTNESQKNIATDLEFASRFWYDRGCENRSRPAGWGRLRGACPPSNAVFCGGRTVEFRQLRGRDLRSRTQRRTSRKKSLQKSGLIAVEMAAYRHSLGPPHRLDWDLVARRQLAICYDSSRQVIR